MSASMGVDKSSIEDRAVSRYPKSVSSPAGLVAADGRMPCSCFACRGQKSGRPRGMVAIGDPAPGDRTPRAPPGHCPPTIEEAGAGRIGFICGHTARSPRGTQRTGRLGWRAAQAATTHAFSRPARAQLQTTAVCPLRPTTGCLGHRSKARKPRRSRISSASSCTRNSRCSRHKMRP